MEKFIPLSELKLSDRSIRLKAKIFSSVKESSDELAQLARKSYSQTKDIPIIMQRALSFSNMLNNMQIYIQDDELIVGNRSKAPGCLPVISNDVEEDCESMAFGHGLGDTIEYTILRKEYSRLVSKQSKLAEQDGLLVAPTGFDSGFGHIIVGYDIILQKGLNGIINEIEAKTAKTAQNDKEKLAFLSAAKTACQAVVNWSLRYAKLAAEMSENCNNSQRKQELLDISRICTYVSSMPARNFHEALQSVWFTHQAVMIEQPGNSISLGRIDQYLYPYYKAAINNGRMTQKMADELLEGFFIKFSENSITPIEVQSFAHITIGGQDEFGNDQTNELSYMILEATAKLHTTQPLIGVRWHENINRSFWNRAVECVGMGNSLPAFFSDKEYLTALLSLGISKKDAYDYAIVGCVEPGIMGKMLGASLGGPLNLLKCLEYAINDGKSLVTDQQIGLKTGYLSEFTSIEQVWEAYKQQVEEAARLIYENILTVDKIQREYYGYPFTSSIMYDAITNCRDITNGARYNFDSVNIVGETNTIDSIILLNELIYKEHKFSPDNLYKSLKNNFNGYEDIRQMLMENDSRFGLGRGNAPDIANYIYSIHNAAFNKYNSPRGGKIICGTWPVTFPTIMGEKTGASADGRLRFSSLADSVGAVQGIDKNGPTSLIRDIWGINGNEYWKGGYVFNIWLNSSFFQDNEDKNKITDFLDTFFLLGGMQLQLNTIDKEVLVNARKNPHGYENLIIRIGGFSAYFISLRPQEQDEIISRMVHKI